MYEKVKRVEDQHDIIITFGASRSHDAVSFLPESYLGIETTDPAAVTQ